MGLKKKQAAEGAVATQRAPKKPKKKLIITLAVIAVIVLAVVVVLPALSGGGPRVPESLYTEETAQKRDIVTELTYSGTLEPADAYTVTSLLSGEILTAEFEEGDTVKKDDILYTIDSSDAETNLQRAENALAQAQRNYTQTQKSLSDLTITAPAAGQLIDLAVELGDDVMAGQLVATIRDSGKMKVEIPFPADEAASFYVGQSANVTVDGSFETLLGTVTAVNASDIVLAGNRIVRMVTIEVENPGAMSSNTSATATIGTSACADSGTFEYKAEKNVLADVSGEVASLPVKEGDIVSSGQSIVILKSDTLQNQLANAADSVEDAQLSLDNQRDALDNYEVQSPIDGTIIDKIYKQGDNLEAGKQLCVIFDLSYLSFVMNVDELDISQVQVGQKVAITADALQGEVFEGTVTKVSINGNTVGGTTSYPVTVRIDNTNGLLPGMNVDASVIVSERLDTISVPVEAVTRGNRVLVKTDGPNAAVEGNPEGLPVGYEYVDVTIGQSDGDYIEILTGIAADDQIAYIKTTAVGTSIYDMMGGGMMVEESGGGGGAVSVTTAEGPRGGY